MDLIKLGSTTAYATEITDGENIEGYTRAMWVEKYQEPGEFKIEGPLSSGLHLFLPLNTLISHLRTREVQIVENIEITQERNEDPQVAISGRSLVSFLENRILGETYVETPASDIPAYSVPAADTWDQIFDLIDEHIAEGGPSVDNSLPGTQAEVDASCTGTVTSDDRTYQYGTIWERVSELLKIDDLGIRMRRPIYTDPVTYFNIYRGANMASSVRFSWQTGDLENINYLFSTKSLKTSARVMGRWVQVVVQGTPDNLERRYMLIDASDIDNQQPSMPTAGALTLIKAAMTIRGREALKKQQKTTISQATVAANASLRFREDYNLGDLVTVDGDFGTSQIMRVTEFAETSDENGSSSIPTLSIPGE